jgi:hypothetical protein
MAVNQVEAVNTLLEKTAGAHGIFEETELKGVYDKNWARWYAAYAVEHGMAALVGHPITADRLAQFLARTNAELEQIKPKPTESWAAYTARRITAEL